MKIEYPTKIARIGAVLALVGSVIWIQWPIKFEELGVAPLIAVLASFVVWIGIEAAGWIESDKGRNSELDQDTRKFNQIVRLIDKNTYYKVKRCYVETFIGEHDYRGLEDFIEYYELDAFPFLNREMQAKFEELHNICRVFIDDLWTLYTSDGRGRATWKNEGWLSDEDYQKVRQKVGLLNQQATDISTAWEEFVQLAFTELQGNSVGIETYEFN